MVSRVGGFVAMIAVFGLATAFLAVKGYPDAWIPVLVGAVIGCGSLAWRSLRRGTL